MFGRMFPTLPPLKVSDAKLQALAEAMIDNNRRQPGRQQSEHPGRLHLFRPVRRSRHHARSHVARRQGEGPARHREFPHAERRPRLRLRPRAGRQPASLCAQSGRRQQARAEAPDRQESQHRRRRLPQRPAAQPRGLRTDRRSSQRREPAGGADASRDAEIPQQGLRHADTAARSAGRYLRRSTPDRDLALSVDRAARLGRAADRKGHRGQDPARRAQVLPLQESALHAGRVLGGRLSPRPLDGAPALSPQQGFQHSAGLRPVLHCSRACRATSSATSRPAAAASQRCRQTGSSTGDGSTNSAPAAARPSR